MIQYDVSQYNHNGTICNYSGENCNENALWNTDEGYYISGGSGQINFEIYSPQQDEGNLYLGIFYDADDESSSGEPDAQFGPF